MRKRNENYLQNLIVPALVFGGITGIFTAIIILLYKLSASYVIDISQSFYQAIREKLYFIPLILLVLFEIAFFLSGIYKKHPRFQLDSR